MTGHPSQPNGKAWHVASWPPLAWLETTLKTAAFVFAFLALRQALSSSAFAMPAGRTLGQWIVLIVLSLGLLAAIFDRLAEREVVAMIFVILNNLAHWGMTLALAMDPGPGRLLISFAALMLVGDLVKLIFIKFHEFTVRDTPRSVLYGLTGFYVLGYVTLLILQLLGG